MAFTPLRQVFNPLSGFNLVPQDAAQIVTVAKSGAMFTTIQAAIDSITDASISKQYLIKVAPGTYAGFVTKPYINFAGESTGTGNTIVAGTTTLCSGTLAEDATQTITRIGFLLTPTTDNQRCIDVTGNFGMLDCFTFVQANSDVETGNIRVTTNSLFAISATSHVYINTAASTKDYFGVEVAGTGQVFTSVSSVRVTTNASSGIHCMFRQTGTNEIIGTTFNEVYQNTNAAFTGEVRGACINAATANNRVFEYCDWRFVGAGGGIATACKLNSAGSSAQMFYSGLTVSISGFPAGQEFISDTSLGDTQKIWLASSNKDLSKTGAGIAVITPYDHYETGFVSWGSGTTYWSYNPTTKIFTVDRRGAGIVKGAPVTWVAGQSVALVNFATNYVYMTSAGIIGVSQTGNKALYTDNIILFEAFVQDQNSIVVKENHPYEFTTAVSSYLHNTNGPLLQSDSSVLGVVSATARTFSFTGENILADHGIESTVPTTSPITWVITGRRISGGAFIATTGTSVPTYYNSVASVVTVTAGSFVVGRSYEITSVGTTDFTLIGAQNSNLGTVFTATGVGTGTGQARQLTDDGTNGDWFVMKCGCVKDSINTATPTFIAHYHTGIFGNQTAARNAIAAKTIDDFPPEIKQLEITRIGYLIIQGNGAGIDGASGAVTPVTDLQISGSYSSSGGTSSAGSLITLDTTSFTGELSGSESTAQLMANRIDAYDSLLDWATGKTYRVGNVVRVTTSGFIGEWRCLTAHTAAAAFSTDVESGHWEIVANSEGSRELVTQTAHGFATKDLIYHTGTNYAKAKADTPLTAEVIGVVLGVTTNKFVLAKTGKITVTGLTVGQYYLSDATAGLATQTEPTAVGSVSKPVFIATSTTEAQINIQRRRTTLINESRNYVINPDAEGAFTTGTTGIPGITANGGANAVTVARDTTTKLFGSASFKLTQAVAGAWQVDWSTSALDLGLSNRLGEVAMVLQGAAVTGGKLRVLDGSSNVIFEQDISTLTSSTKPVKVGGTFPIPTLPSALTLRLLGTAAIDSGGLFVDQVYTGEPKSVSSGAITTPWQSYTPTVSNLGAGGSAVNLGYWRRVGDSLEMRIQWQKDATPGSGSGTVSWSLPSGLTVDTTKTRASSSALVTGNGYTYGVEAAAQFHPVEVVVNSTYGLDRIVLIDTGSGNTHSGAAFTASSEVSVVITLPIVGWAATDIVTPEASLVEYASNNGPTWDAANSTDFTVNTNSSAGSLVGGTLTAGREKRVRFQRPILQTDSLVLEISKDQVNWIALSGADAGLGVQPHSYQNTTTYGAALRALSGATATDVSVNFGQYMYSSGATFASAGTNWPGSGLYWRVKKTPAGAGSQSFYLQGPVKGGNSGTAIASGYIGEEVFNNAVTATTLTTSEADIVTATLNKGQYIIGYSISIGHTTGATSGNNLYVTTKITDNSNNELVNSARSTRCKTVAAVANEATYIHAFQAKLTVAADSTTIKLRAYRTDGAGTNIGEILHSGAQKSNWYAIRLD